MVLFCEKFNDVMDNYLFCKEIIVIKFVNNIVNDMGFNFMVCMYEEIGVNEVEIVFCYLIVKEVF